MIQRHVISLEEARDNEPIYVKYWKYFYAGACDGEVKLRLNNKRNCDLNPEEFDKITDLNGVTFLLVENAAQEGKELVLYYEEKKGGRFIWQ
jgi:hypothetical protein